MKSHYPGCMSDEECKCQDYDNEIEGEPTRANCKICDDSGTRIIGERVFEGGGSRSKAMARNRNLSDRLASLSEWCKSRSEGIHDTETTLTMLKKKVADIERRVNQSGWNAHLPECSNCGRSTRETPQYWICNNCGQRHSRNVKEHAPTPAGASVETGVEP